MKFLISVIARYYHLNQDTEHFHHQRKFLYAALWWTPYHQRQPLFWFLYPWIIFGSSWNLYKWNHILYNFCIYPLFLKYNICEIHPCQHFINSLFFYFWVFWSNLLMTLLPVDTNLVYFHLELLWIKLHDLSWASQLVNICFYSS